MDYINLLRVIATLMVFLLHTSLFNGGNFSAGQIFCDYPNLFFFKTPAWAGCWIFFVLSGYLAGKGFFERRYQLSNNDIKRYYLNKLHKVYFPTIAFSFISVLFVYPKFIVDYKHYFFDIITFSYNGNPGMPGIGATWFVFTLMWLYLITPIFVKLIKYIERERTAVLCGGGSLSWDIL